MREQRIKPDDAQIAIAIQMLSTCRYFPADDIPRAVITDILTKMVGDVRELKWLVAEIVNKVREWPGPVELRGLFCIRFKPADGIEVDCEIAGYTPNDIEGQQPQLPPPEHKLLGAAKNPEPDQLSAKERDEIAKLKARIYLKSTQERLNNIRNLPLTPVDVPEYLK